MHCGADPSVFGKTNQEMDTALKRAEQRGEKVPGFPEGKELLIPYAAFCVKTKNEETGTKVIILPKTGHSFPFITTFILDRSNLLKFLRCLFKLSSYAKCASE